MSRYRDFGCRCNARRGFSLVEALMATTILAVCGSAVLLGISSSVQTTTHSLDEAIGIGLAEQLLDEIAGCRYVDPGASPTHTTLGPTAAEVVGLSRERFDAIDDYNGFYASPPVDVWGVPLGTEDGLGGTRHAKLKLPSTMLARWRQAVRVTYASTANPSVDLSAGVTSSYRAVEVQVGYVDAQGGQHKVARLRRVFTYVP
jgi:prepilin-type N-terminal cleavage/methylation domain-containing protein